MVSISDIFSIVVFPGALFIIVYALYCNWLSRKTVARLQNRRGPMHTGYAGMLQPFADLVKLLAKEDITPGAANKALFISRTRRHLRPSPLSSLPHPHTVNH